MMLEQQNTQLVREACERFQAGDLSGFLELCSEDIEWKLDEAYEVAFSGTRRGKDAIMALFRTLDQAQHPLHFEPREFIAQGNKVVALGRYASGMPSTQHAFNSDWTEIFTIRDGKIACLREVVDNAAGVAAYRRR